jgi:hypothetical protein
MPRSSRRILESLGLSNYLAVATVADEERLCGRLVVSRDVLESLGRHLDAAGLAFRVAAFHIIEKRDVVQGTSHRASFVPADRDTRSRVLYFARKPEHCEGAEYAELHGHHPLIGELFGYPACCVEAFANAGNQSLDRWPAVVDSPGPFERILNPVSFYVYGAPSLIFHFPCSLRCRHSIALAEERRQRVARLAGKPGMLARIGRGIALYGPEVGIGLVTSYREVGPQEYRIDRIDTRDVRTCETFVGATNLGLIDGRSARLNGRPLGGPGQFITRFD